MRIPRVLLPSVLKPMYRLCGSITSLIILNLIQDAAVGLSSSSIAVVARNWRGEVVLARSKRVNTKIPLQAEAKALLWAGHTAVELGAEKVILNLILRVANGCCPFPCEVVSSE
uniref:RNase H type-1 domain-containing protein n=1 Tax=Fagus sylvatica TaxID=28930 RepID=A0A2N9HSP4_FAGSY